MTEPPNPVAKPSKRHRAPKVTRRAILAAPLPALGVTALVLWATDPYYAPMSRSTKGSTSARPAERSRLSILACLPTTAPVLPAVG